jgi:hypothetical protein
LDLNVISRRRGWFLSKITGSLDFSKKIAVANYKSIKEHGLIPGTFVLIRDIDKPQSQDKFILLPSFETKGQLYDFLDYLVKEFGSYEKFHKIDENYLHFIKNLMKSLSKAKEEQEKVKFCDLELQTEHSARHEKGVNIGLPDFWLMKNDIFVGETVLLRADFPSPVIA